MVSHPDITQADWQRAFRSVEVHTTVKCTGMMISTYANVRDGRNAHPSVKTLGRDVGKGEGAIRRALKVLTVRGWLTQEAPYVPGKMSTTYRLTVPAGQVVTHDHLPPSQEADEAGQVVTRDQLELVTRDQHTETSTHSSYLSTSNSLLSASPLVRPSDLEPAPEEVPDAWEKAERLDPVVSASRSEPAEPAPAEDEAEAEVSDPWAPAEDQDQVGPLPPSPASPSEEEEPSLCTVSSPLSTPPEGEPPVERAFSSGSRYASSPLNTPPGGEPLSYVPSWRR